MRYFSDNSLSIGNTPLIKINKIAKNSQIFCKIEGQNPSYSVKCRAAYAMIEDAIRTGRLKPGIELIEPTSGNTGIALAYIAAAKGYRLTLTMPDTMSIERRRLIAVFGANLILTEGAKGMKGAIAKVEELVNESPGKYIIPGQFDNPANPRIHRLTTGPEIWQDTEGEVDIVVAGVGTGGTISGIGQYIKHDRNKQIMCVAVEPEASPVISQELAGEELKPSPHKIQGIGAGFIPATLDLSILDRAVKISNEEAMDTARRMAKEEGILCGISSGAAMAAAIKISQESGMENKKIVVILPDSGERYLSTALFENI